MSGQSIDWILDLDMHQFDSFHGTCIRISTEESMKLTSAFRMAQHGTKEQMKKYLDACQKILRTAQPEQTDSARLLKNFGNRGF